MDGKLHFCYTEKKKKKKKNNLKRPYLAWYSSLRRSYYCQDLSNPSHEIVATHPLLTPFLFHDRNLGQRGALVQFRLDLLLQPDLFLGASLSARGVGMGTMATVAAVAAVVAMKTGNVDAVTAVGSMRRTVGMFSTYMHALRLEKPYRP